MNLTGAPVVECKDLGEGRGDMFSSILSSDFYLVPSPSHCGATCEACASQLHVNRARRVICTTKTFTLSVADFALRKRLIQYVSTNFCVSFTCVLQF